MTEKPFRRVFDGEDICLVNNATNEHFWIIEKNKPMGNAIFKLENHINQIIEDRNELQFKYNLEVLQRKSLLKENEELKKQVEDLEFALRTVLAHQRIEKEDPSDTVYEFKKKLEKW